MQTQAILARVQALLLRPKATWGEIDKQTVGLQETYLNYVIPLAAIPAVANFFGLALIGVGPPGQHARLDFVAGLFEALISLGLTLGMVYALAYAIDWLAPQFGAQRNFNQAFKISAFAPTAFWVTGLLQLIPALRIFALVGAAYSLYLLYLALPVLMRPQTGKEQTYVLAIGGVGVVLWVIKAILLSLAFPLTSV
jgi:hypothetical protein